MPATIEEIRVVLFKDAEDNWTAQSLGSDYAIAEPSKANALTAWLEEASSDSWMTDSPVREALVRLAENGGRIVVEVRG